MTRKRQEIELSKRRGENFLLWRSHSTADLKRLLATKAAAPRKKNPKKYPRKIRKDTSIVGLTQRGISQSISLMPIKIHAHTKKKSFSEFLHTLPSDVLNFLLDFCTTFNFLPFPYLSNIYYSVTVWKLVVDRKIPNMNCSAF